MSHEQLSVRTGDGDCPGGYCVDSTCSGTLGTCVPECV